MKTVKFIKQLAAALMIVAIAFAGCDKDDPVKVSGINLSKTTLTLVEGSSETLKATVVPDEAADKTVTWDSSNPNVATVLSTGMVTAITPGSATVVATTHDGSFTAECTVTVQSAPINVTGVTLSETTLTLVVGKTDTLVATVVPDEATDKAVEWSSSNEKVATVSDAGVVTAITAGEATVVATTQDGSFTAECTVTVPINVTGVTLSKTALTLVVGKTDTLTATVVPDEATDKTVEWSSSNEMVATVSNAGVVTAIAVGEAIITVTTKDGSFKDECTVKVSEEGIVMTTSRKGEIWFQLAGTGTAIIDWGDGSAPETVTLFAGTSGVSTFYHTFLGTAASHTIVIDGQEITHLWCRDMQVTSLDVSNNRALEYLWCTYNQLTSLDVSNNTALTTLYCDDNQLTNLDVSNNTALTRLDCDNNQLTSLDVTNNVVLTVLRCHSNLFTTEGLNALFGTLHSNTIADEKTISVTNNPGTANCDQSIATAKGWKVDIYTNYKRNENPPQGY